MTGTIFALVLTTFLTTGQAQYDVLEIYPSYAECSNAAQEQKINAECYPVDNIIHNGEETPAGF